MSENSQDVSVSCFSEKTGISLGFGYSLDENYDEDEQLSIGIGESFWENYFEFESGIDRAKKMIDDGLFTEYREALFDVFGHFQLAFEVDGVEEERSYGIDPDEIIYSMLES